MQLHQMRYVLEVHQTGSITKSAENLFMTLPNLSSAIADLKDELGIRIIKRTNRGVDTTEEGMRFIAYAQGIVIQVSNLEQLYAHRKHSGVTLRYVWSGTTALLMRQFTQQLPPQVPVNIHLIEGSHLAVLNAVQQRKADICKVSFPKSTIEAYERYA